MSTHCEFTVPVNDDKNDPFKDLFKDGPVVDPIFAQDGETKRFPLVPAQAPAPKLPHVPKQGVREWMREHRVGVVCVLWAAPFGLLIGIVLAMKAGITPDAITPPALRSDKVQTAPAQPESSGNPTQPQHRNNRSDVVTNRGEQASASPKSSSKTTASPSASASTASSPSASATSSAPASPEATGTPSQGTTTTPSPESTPSASEIPPAQTSAPAEPSTPETTISAPAAATVAAGADESSTPSPS